MTFINQDLTGNSFPSSYVWTGTNTDGSDASNGGYSLDTPYSYAMVGYTFSTNPWNADYTLHTYNSLSLFGMSQVLTVPNRGSRTGQSRDRAGGFGGDWLRRPAEEVSPGLKRSGGEVATCSSPARHFGLAGLFLFIRTTGGLTARPGFAMLG